MKIMKMNVRRYGWGKLLAGWVGLMALCGGMAHAQCDETTWLKASKTEYLDASGTLQETREEKSVLEITKKAFIRYEREGEELKEDFRGEITSSKCDWKVPFKEGKSVLRVTFQENGESRDATVTIEGKQGKVTLLAEIDARPDRKIRVLADSFANKK